MGNIGEFAQISGALQMKSTLLAVAVCLLMIGSAGQCLAQAELVNDNFDNGVNGTYLGPNWTGCGFFLGTYNKLVYQNNQAGGGGYYSQECALYTGYGAFPSDQYATATVVAPTPSSTTQAGVQLRQNPVPSTPESYIACGWNAQDFPADYHYRIWSMAPNPATGGPTSLFLSNVTPATNDVIWCQVLGTTITMKVNGTILATVTDTSGLTSGYPGLYYVDPNGGEPPSNDVIWDNFAAGAGPALVSLTITPGSATATAGSFVQLTGTATYADGTVATLSNWSSSDTSVVTVDSTGFAYAASPGTVTMTGTTGVDSGTATVTVSAAQGYTPLVHDSFVGSTGSYLGSNWTGCGYYGGAYSPLVYLYRVWGLPERPVRHRHRRSHNPQQHSAGRSSTTAKRDTICSRVLHRLRLERAGLPGGLSLSYLEHATRSPHRGADESFLKQSDSSAQRRNLVPGHGDDGQHAGQWDDHRNRDRQFGRHRWLSRAVLYRSQW
jgi:hypothetical protein